MDFPDLPGIMDLPDIEYLQRIQELQRIHESQNTQDVPNIQYQPSIQEESDIQDLASFLASEADMASPIFRMDGVVNTLPQDNSTSHVLTNLNEAPADSFASSAFREWENPSNTFWDGYGHNNTSGASNILPAQPSWNPDWNSPLSNNATLDVSEIVPEVVEVRRMEIVEPQQADRIESKQAEAQQGEDMKSQQAEVVDLQQAQRPAATLRPAPLGPPPYAMSHWTENDKATFMRLLTTHGTNWELISQGMPAYSSKRWQKTKGVVRSHYIRSIELNKDLNMKAIGEAADLRIVSEREARLRREQQTPPAIQIPHIPRYSNWTVALRAEFIRLLSIHGRNWTIIAAQMSHMRGRPQSLASVTNYYYHCLKHGDMEMKRIADDAEQLSDRDADGETDKEEQENEGEGAVSSPN